jgi:hypothetical protein
MAYNFQTGGKNKNDFIYKNRRYATIYVITISLFSQHVSALSGHHQAQLVETFTLHRNSKNIFFIKIEVRCIGSSCP